MQWAGRSSVSAGGDHSHLEAGSHPQETSAREMAINSGSQGASTNDFVNPTLCSLSYASIDDASVDDTAAYVYEAGRGTLLAKLDIKSAYRHVPMHPGDRHLLGIQWKGKTFVDTCLPFGLRSAPKLLNAVADALEWVIVNEGGSQVEFVIPLPGRFLVWGDVLAQKPAAGSWTSLYVYAEK